MERDLSARLDGVIQLAQCLEEYEQVIPWETMNRIQATGRAQDVSELPWLISLTQVEVLESDPTNFLLARMSVIAMAHYPATELAEALRSFLAQNTVTLPGSKIGILKIIEMLPPGSFAEPLLQEYAADDSMRLRREVEAVLARREDRTGLTT